jgi:hypothetical protein
LTFFAGSDGWTTKAVGTSAMIPIGAKSLIES